MATKEEILAAVTDVLVESLAVDENEVTPEATLVDDLGAESIDLLEIVFNLEKKFNIKINRGELIPTEKLDDPQYVQEGKLTEAGLAMLKEALPSADLETFSQNPVIQNLAKVLAVRDLVYLVSTKLG